VVSEREIKEAKDVACLLKEILERKYKLKSFIMTTGSRGYHVVVPIKQTVSFDAARAFAKEVAGIAMQENPKLCTTAVRKASRRGRVYIDVMRNAYAQHQVSPYAIRPLPGAPIAMPISWMQLKKVDPQSFTLSNYRGAPRNPWSGFARGAKSLSSVYTLNKK
jgi:Predicted eukaryotic-type DNA primase